MEKKINSIDELVDNISRGGEVEFIYKGKNYSITNIREGVCVSQAHNEANEIIYKTASEIADYVIEGRKINEIIADLVITFRCF